MGTRGLPSNAQDGRSSPRPAESPVASSRQDQGTVGRSRKLESAQHEIHHRQHPSRTLGSPLLCEGASDAPPEVARIYDDADPANERSRFVLLPACSAFTHSLSARYGHQECDPSHLLRLDLWLRARWNFESSRRHSQCRSFCRSQPCAYLFRVLPSERYLTLAPRGQNNPQQLPPQILVVILDDAKTYDDVKRDLMFVSLLSFDVRYSRFRMLFRLNLPVPVVSQCLLCSPTFLSSSVSLLIIPPNADSKMSKDRGVDQYCGNGALGFRFSQLMSS